MLRASSLWPSWPPLHVARRWSRSHHSPSGPAEKEHHMTGSRVSAVTAYTAHREWASRPPDERFASIDTLYEAARARRQRIDERTIETGEFRAEAVDGDLALRETSGRTAALTHWSFGQLATIASAPPNYLRTLPAEIAAEAINFGLQRVERERHQLFVEDTAPW